jgi:ribosomal protein S6
MIKELKQDDTINMLKSRIETRNIKLQALKEKLAEQSKVLHARTTKLLSQGALVKGDLIAGKLDLPTDTITNLLKEHGSTIEPKLANWALRQLGYLTKTHEVTDTGHYYGRNIKSSPRSKTTLARWFPSEFPNLLKQIESTIEDLVNN